MTYASLCTGIGGWDRGLEAAGITPLWFCEIDKACQRVLHRHWPLIPCYDDMTALPSNLPRPDVLAMGTPCQGFSTAGLRKSLGDDRSNLCLMAAKIVYELNPRYVCWENVPGVLSTTDNAFGCFLAALVGADTPLIPPAQCGGRWTDAGMVAGPKRHAAWRILDSQFFGLAQRRKRVFLVADSGDESCGEILFERKSRSWHPPARGEAGQGVAPTIRSRTKGGGGLGTDAECDGALISEISGTLRTKSQSSPKVGDGQIYSLIPELAGCLQERDSKGCDSKGCDSDTKPGHLIPENVNSEAIAIRTAQTSSNGCGIDESGTSYTLDGAQGQAVASSKTKWRVRRLTPTEFSRLSGFPDTWNDFIIDSARYRQFGNCVNVPVSAWIGKRIVNYVSAQRPAEGV